MSAAELIASPTTSCSPRNQLRLITAHLKAENHHKTVTLRGLGARATVWSGGEPGTIKHNYRQAYYT